MGFFSSLKEKFSGKKVEQSTVLPTLQDINKENNDLTKVETTTVESVINAPPSPPQTGAAQETFPSMGPSPEGVTLPIIGQKAEMPKKKKSAPKKKKAAAKKKSVKKAAPKKKASKKPQKKKGKKKR